jgi:peptide/nickel transport system ATP-binding protein
MYGGKLVEYGPMEDVIGSPSHPYTMGLKNSFPDITKPQKELVSIPGTPPKLEDPQPTCRFLHRCPFATEECRQLEHPEREPVDGDQKHVSACYHTEEADELRDQASVPETWGVDREQLSSAISGEEKVQVNDLQKWYSQRQGILPSLLGKEQKYVKAVDGVSFSINEGEILGIAGESGCGKSTLGETLCLLEDMTEGEINISGMKISDSSEEQSIDMNQFRQDVQIIFQDPYSALNPKDRIRTIISEPLRVHGIGDIDKRDAIVRETLERVGLPSNDEFVRRYPDDLSGGQRQRVAIARALVLDPKVLVCDEPTSMLDVSLQAEILSLLKRIAREDDVSILLISHDISSLQYISDRIGIMYLGKIIEIGESTELVTDPSHPYTQALISAVPTMNISIDRSRVTLQGEVGDPIDLPNGCNFAPRCPEATEECVEGQPNLERIHTERKVACYKRDPQEPDPEEPLSEI